MSSASRGVGASAESSAIRAVAAANVLRRAKRQARPTAQGSFAMLSRYTSGAGRPRSDMALEHDRAFEEQRPNLRALDAESAPGRINGVAKVRVRLVGILEVDGVVAVSI